jgi:hypothetical protein
LRPRGSAHGPWPGSKTSWRDAPQIGVTLQVLRWIVLGAVLLVCLGLLVGSAWTTQALEPRLRRQAEERRKLNEEWLAVRTARQQHGECPYCGIPRHWHIAPMVGENQPDDD